ncbi:MAG: hypothetical protein WCI40_08730 [Verrucomicrobiota bacterium]
MSAFANFPPLDPVPLPAPVWLFKLLHETVLCLHFVVVQWVLGWLFIGLIWNLWGRSRRNTTMVAGSTRIAGSLPLLMTYLINFGIPPLLFAQVLYGNFLYTSSVLIGVWWISVVGLVILTYSSIYAGSLRAAKAWWGYGLIALVLGVAIAKIYSTNMTLMLHPEAWGPMFRANAHGTGLPPHDPTLLPRWLLMLAGSLTLGGLALVVTGSGKKPGLAEKGFLVFNGGWIAAMGAVLQSTAAFSVFQTQPGAVLARLSENALYHPLPIVWLGLAGAVVGVGLLAMTRREKASLWLGSLAAGAGALLTAVTVIYRDGIRDMTLLAQGYNVWDMKVVANWPVVLLFLGVFVLGLLAMAWMISIALHAKPAKEEPAP